MKFSVSSSSFSPLIKRAFSAVRGSKNNGVEPVVHVAVKSGVLTVSSDNGLMGFRSTIGVNGSLDGSFCVDAKTLNDVIGGSSGDISFLRSKRGKNISNKVSVSFGTTKYKLLVSSESESVEVSRDIGDNVLSMKMSDLISALSSTSGSVDEKSGMTSINGVFVEIISDGVLRFVSTDGHRLSLAEVPCSGNPTISADGLIPVGAIPMIKSLPKKGTVKIGFSDAFMTVETDNCSMWFTLIDGAFPSYHSLIPDGQGDKVTVDQRVFINSLRRLEVAAKSTSNGPVSLSVSDGEMSLKSGSSNSMQSSESFCVDGGDVQPIGFNVDYLKSAISTCKGDKIELFSDSSLSPCMIRGVSDGTPVFILMPMRLD